LTLRLRLSLAFIFVVLAPLVVAAVIVERGVPDALDTSAQNRLVASRAGAVALVRETCDRATLAAELLARVTTASNAADRPRAATRAVRDLVRRGVAGYAVVTDGSGAVLASAGEFAGSAAAPPSPDEVGSCSRDVAPVMSVAAIGDSVTVQSAAGGTVGQAAAAVGLDEAWARGISAATNAGVTLVSDGRVLSTTEPADVASELALDTDKLVGTTPRASGGRLATAAVVGAGQSVLVLSVDRPGIRALELILVLVLLIGLLLAALIGWLLARVTTRPLAELSDAAARVAAGDLDTRIETTSGDEIGQLAAAFNEMTDELRSYVGELESSRDQLRTNFARLGDTLSSTHDLGRILSVILDTAMGSVRATAGAAYVQQAGRDELVLRAGRGLEARGGSPRLPIGEGVTGSVAATGEAVRGSAGSGGLQLAASEPTAKELICVPLRTSTGVLGVLNLYDRDDDRPFDAGDLETIRTFAGQAAVALDNVLLHHEAQRLSVTDALTGLGNYRFFQSSLIREIERAARFGRELAVLMLDLDRFKLVNDVHGHQVGDTVLVEVADRIRAEVREVDIVARYGGEEFVVVLPETGREGAGHTAGRICEAMRQMPFDVSGLQLPITVSIGAAVFPADGDTTASLIRAADEALYAAKGGGRDQWHMATEVDEVAR
jgi:two-component system, cell cycle response regulator